VCSVVRRNNGECQTFGSQGRDQDEVVISEGSKKRLHHVSFSVDPTRIEDFEGLLNNKHIDFQKHAPSGGCNGGIWFQDPWGIWLNLVPRLAAAPREVKRDFPSNEFGEKNRIGIAAFEKLDNSGLPRRLGHIVMFVPDWEKAEKFYTDILGLRVTERAPGRISFFNAPFGACWDHHCFAILANPAPGIQHSGFEMASIDQVGFCAQRMRRNGYGDGFGPGRQALGSNYFSYIRDPWGSHTEVFADIDQLDANWETKDWDELPKVWGPEWHPTFWTENLESQ